MKTHETIRKANETYHQWIAADYEKAHHSCFDSTCVVRQRLESIVDELAAASGGGSLVEFGCGTGSLLKYAEGRFDHVVGADISPAMLTQAHNRRLNVMKGDIVRLPFPDDSFDAAICVSVLHHLQSPEEVLSEMVRVLKPGRPLWTDHDPNKGFFLKWPRVNRFFRQFFRHEEHVVQSFAATAAVSPETWIEVERDAEYLAGPGIDADALVEHLKSLGCADARVEHHAYGDLPGKALDLMNILRLEYWPKPLGPYFRLRATTPG